ncbi:MAG: hypothetical protein IPF62_07040 [Bacteroidetes bacterium]|nr:hypothetical protein [Bacteroidota bacterium]
MILYIVTQCIGSCPQLRMLRVVVVIPEYYPAGCTTSHNAAGGAKSY